MPFLTANATIQRGVIGIIEADLAETLDAEVRIRTTEVVEQAEQLRDLSSRVLQAQDEERRHMPVNCTTAPAKSSLRSR
ncbi:MAG TPA: hypothetical protein VIX37_07345 [Candidatus Sulfotelmatobacter sp.]